MPRSKTKRLMMAGAGILGVLAIVGASFFVRSINSHAAANPHVLSPNFLSTHAKASYGDLPSLATAKVNDKSVGKGKKQGSACVPSIAGVSNFCGTFTENGFDAFGNPQNTWTYNLLGNPPQDGKTTTFNAPIVPVKVELLNADNSVAYTIDPTGDVQPTLDSPVFSDAKYSSSDKPTQFADAVQRAEFPNVEKNSWHTMLAPVVEPEVTMQVPSGFWDVGLNTDGSVAFSLVDYNTFINLMFPAAGVPVNNSTIIGALELNGTMTTSNVSTFLFDNVYLYEGNINACCVLGFHGPDQEPGPNGTINNFDMIYASYITPGLFNGGLADVTGLSHEMAETYGDPFGGAYFPYAYVPWWFSGPDPTFTQCQPVMEVGDVVEVYTAFENDTFAITMKHGVTYHPQTVALLQWFEGQTPSTATNGQYSYPGDILTSAAVSQQPGCTGPAS